MKKNKLVIVIILIMLIFSNCSSDSTQAATLKSKSSHLSVITIGTGTPKYSETAAKSSTAIEYNGKYYLIDTGDGTNSNLEKSQFDFKDIGGIFFTHHHIDHTTDFFDIYVKCVLSGSDNFEIFGPPRTQKFVDFVNEVYLDDVLYRMIETTKNTRKIDKDKIATFTNVTEITGTHEMEIDGLKITTAEMSHTMYNLAYRFDANGESIVISGDTSYDEDLIQLSKDADILVIDGSLYRGSSADKQKKEPSIKPFYEYGGNFQVDPHLSFEDMIKIAKEAGVKKLVITHYNSGSIAKNRIENSIAKIKKEFTGDVIYAEDMMKITIGESTPYVFNGNDTLSYPIVDTDQKDFYSDTALIKEPQIGDAFYGQDASYSTNEPSYEDNNDGTISDKVTGLMWAKDMGDKMTYEDAFSYAKESKLGGYDDWRIPTIKELYSLIQFDGRVKGKNATDDLFIDTDYFLQPLGDTSKNEREIDAQTWSSTKYVGKTMRNNSTIFGVNFIDGRIKGYPQYNGRLNTENKMYFRLVRGNTSYGINNFVDNGDGTISDLATGLTWQQNDSGKAMDWKSALNYAENLNLADHDDWRLPNAKELQSIVDYNRSLQTTNSPAIDALFNTTDIKAPDGNLNYPYFWTGTTHLDGINPYSNGVYIAFGEALGKMNGNLMDVHGAGAQRSDPKSGDKEDYPISVGPQGDIRTVFNFVRCVRTTN